MQTQKSSLRNKIIETARQEFFKHGYKNSSMRLIAKKSDVGLSNIYNYFTNKEEILYEVLNPLLKALDNLMEEHNSSKSISLNVFTSEAYQYEHMKMFLHLITNFKMELRLLLFNVHGSSLESFREEYTEKHTQMGIEYMQKMKTKYPYINTNIPNFFIHTMSAWWLTIIGEVVDHNLSDKETEAFLTNYMIFSTAGWKQLMKV